MEVKSVTDENDVMEFKTLTEDKISLEDKMSLEEKSLKQDDDRYGKLSSFWALLYCQ